MTLELHEMTVADYEETYALWEESEGIGLGESDRRDAIASFLERNPGSSFVARIDGRLVGAVLCGNDGRRGFIHHLAVAPSHRHAGIGRALVARCLEGVAELGIAKCHLFVFHENDAGNEFWRRTGWTERAELKMFSKFVRARD